MPNHGAVGARAGGVGNHAKRSTHIDYRGSTGLLSLSNRPVSERLFAVIALALVMGLVFGGLRVADAEGNAAQFGQVSQLAQLGVRDTALIQDLENERDVTAGLVTKGLVANGGGGSALGPLFAATDTAAERVRQAAAAVGGSLPANIRADVDTVLADISPSRITALHHTLASGADAPAEVATYGAVIGDMITLNDLISQGVSDAALANDVRALNFLSLAKEEASRQRALLYSLFNDPYFMHGEPSPNDTAELSAVNLATTQEDTDEAAFRASATPAETTEFTVALSAPDIGSASEIEDFVYGNAPTAPSTTPIVPNPLAVITAIGFTLKQVPQEWYSSMSARVDSLRSVEQTIAANIASRAQSLQSGAQRSALITGIITAVVLLLVLSAALLVARSLVLPLRRLRTGALEVATVELPQRVRQLGEASDAAVDTNVAPIDVLTTDEVGQVARAFDQVHAEAVRLAGNEAMLRRSFNAVFVNLSRRSQSLIERLARTIDSLEQNEDDPARLSSLFSMDHLVTRMRRNSENLLLLAGHEGARRWSEPVALADVARAATSEIEQYSRVVLNIQPGVAVIGQAVSDVVHLLAELIENATMFSPKDTQVLVSGQDLNSGGVLIEITDRGIGVSAARMAEMNWRLDNPPVMDVSVSRHMGLFAVIRLAERHRIRVRLRPAAPQGLTALVWLPDSVIERIGRGYTTPAGWSRHYAGQGGYVAQGGMESGRAPGQPDGGAGPALDGPRVAVTAGAARIGSGTPGFEPEEEVMSNWFRSRRISATGVGSGSAPQSRAPAASGGWHSAPASPGAGGPYGADPLTQQRRAAEIIAEPVRGGQTVAGLPVRVPQANLIPGTAGGARPPEGRGPAGPRHAQAATAPLPQRSPEMARSRLSGFQRGARRAESQQHRAGEGADR